MRILSLLVRHGTDKYSSAMEDVASLFAKQMPGVGWDLLVIDNTLSEDFEQRIGPQRTLIGASNDHWEFSAWDAGIRYVADRLFHYDLINLTTSAFRTLYTRYLERFDTHMLRLILCRAAAVGHIDYYNEPVTVRDRVSQSWLRSSFLLIPPAELKVLGSMVTIKNASEFFTGDPTAPFREQAPLSQNYRKYLLDWLTGEGTGQGVEWHSRFVLTHETLPWFESKAITILNEHLLSVRLRTQGCAMVDATWLATQAKAMPPGIQTLGAIPSWRSQVISRDTDPVEAEALFDLTMMGLLQRNS